VSFKLRQLYARGKDLRYPPDRRLGGPQSRPGHWRRRIFCPHWDSNSGPSVVRPQPAAISTELTLIHLKVNFFMFLLYCATRGMSWVGHVAPMGVIRISCEILKKRHYLGEEYRDV
jgi:hypothetical protein